jgi:hypothetical protein
MSVILSFVYVAILVFALVDIITTDNWRIRYLPKIGWVLLVIFLPLIGSLLWLFLGKERSGSEPAVSFGDPRREVGIRRQSTPEDDSAAIEREIEFHEKQAEIRRLEAQLKAKRANPNP